MAALPIKCEHCKTKLTWTKSLVDLVCPNEDCHGAEFKLLHHFFQVIKVDSLGPGELEKMVNAGFDTIPKLLQVKETQLQKLDKFGSIKARKLAGGIAKCLKDVKLAKLMHASGLFQDATSGLGSTKLQIIIDKLGVQAVTSPNTKIDNMLTLKIMSIHGMGENGARLFADNLAEFLQLYAQIKNTLSLGDGKFKSTKLLGSGFCFTGFRNEPLQKVIEENGGKVTSGVTGATTVLFSAGSSSKTSAAQKKGITIISSVDAESYIAKKLKG